MPKNRPSEKKVRIALRLLQHSIIALSLYDIEDTDLEYAKIWMKKAEDEFVEYLNDN